MGRRGLVRDAGIHCILTNAASGQKPRGQGRDPDEPVNWTAKLIAPATPVILSNLVVRVGAVRKFYVSFANLPPVISFLSHGCGG
jgi:hypothetical protein